MVMFVVVSLSRRRWRFEPKLLVSHMAAGKSDVATDAESRTSDDKRCGRERCRTARPFHRRKHPYDRKPGENVKCVDQFLTARHVLIEPLIANRVGHRCDSIIRRLTVVISWPRRQPTQKHEHQRNDDGRAPARNYGQQKPDNSK